MSRQQAGPGKIIAFHGGKSGEGKSFIAQHLAAALSQHGKQSVLIFDLDATSRHDHMVRWNLEPEPALADITGHIARFDEQTILGYFPQSQVQRVAVACLGKDKQTAMGVASQQIFRALSLFQKAYDFIILDGLNGWEQLTLELLDASDQMILVCSPDLVGLKQEAGDCAVYRDLKFPAQKIGLILNRSDHPGALTVKHLEKALPGHSVLAALPYAAQATDALNQYQDIISLYPNCSFSKAMLQLRDKVVGQGKIRDSEQLDEQTERLQEKASIHIDRLSIKERIHALILENPELKALASESGRSTGSQQMLREQVEAVVTSLMAMEAPELTNREERETLVREVVDEALGLGPLEDMIRDEAVTEIMVNHKNQIYMERSGKLTLSDKSFLNDKQLMTVIERIVAPLGRRIDESQPYVDARLADGSRVNAIIPPLALKGPSLTIRKFSKKRLRIGDLVKFGSLPQEWADFLGAAVAARKNIVISGGTGSGKTTLLNIISSFIPENERIVTVEDAAELNLPQPHVVTLEARPANIEGKGAVTIRDLVRNCLRMRPDRIVVGECRGGEALDMLQAMNTGHDGSLTTAHANSPQDTMSRLETMVLMSGMDLPIRAIREQIAGAVDLVVQQTRLQDGTRKVTQIAEVDGIEDGKIALKDIFVYKQTGLDKHKHVQGMYKATGYIPPFVKALELQGILLDASIFKKK